MTAYETIPFGDVEPVEPPLASGVPELTTERELLFLEGSAFAPVQRDDIVGIDETVARVDDLVAWLAAAGRWDELGGRPEPGVLFHGPPGTGKTLVARYLATRTTACFVDVRDFPCSGRRLTAADVRALFAHARRAYDETGRPIVLFWDEFELSAGCPPAQPAAREVVAALRAELDGIGGHPRGVLLVACTNHQALIDPALRRPGRIGLGVPFTTPDRRGRAILLERQLAGRPAGEPIDRHALAALLGPEATAATIEAAVASAWQRAVLRALHENRRPALREEDLTEAFLDRALGPRPPHRRLELAELLPVAIHEIGHALAAAVFGVPLRFVTVRPGFEMLGQMSFHPRSERTTTHADVRAHIRIALAGMPAEEIAGLDPHASGEADTRCATALALGLVDRNGAGRRNGVFNPNAASARRTTPDVSQAALRRADRDARALLRGARRETRRALRRIGSARIHALARVLVERETLLAPEFDREIRSRLGDPRRYARPGWRAGRARRP